MAGTGVTGESEVRKVLEAACGRRELLILVTPYMHFETNFLNLDGDAFQARITMGVEEATYGLRSPELHFRFPHATRFLDAPTRLLGFGLLQGRRTLRLAIPKQLLDDEQRRAYRVERTGRASVTFSTAKFDLKSGQLVNLSTSGARVSYQGEPLEALVRPGDLIAISITLTEEIRIDHRATVRWVTGRMMGLEFSPELASEVLIPLSRWVFQRREEDKQRVDTFVPEALPQNGGQAGMVLVSSSPELEESLREMLTGLPVLQRVGPAVQPLKEALVPAPQLCFFHIPDASLDTRRRLKTLVEVLGGKVPFVLLGTSVEQGMLFDLGSEHRAAAVYDLGTRPGPFFLRLVQGILRRRAAEG